jgi:RNA binding exosome subunit
MQGGEIMKKLSFLITALAILVLAQAARADLLGDLLKGVKAPSSKGSVLDNDTVVSGLKEALSVGTKSAVASVSNTDGYFGNQMIKILMPEKIKNVADVLGKMGFQKQVDDFVLAMNRAAEKAAPEATNYFVGAIKEMTLQDGQKILNGGNTAATDYFKSKTSDKLYTAFKPIVSRSMEEVGVARAYKNMMSSYSSLPFVKSESLDVDNYVTNKALDGLFYMVGQEEQKIRTNPAARTTELLKKVFAR